MKWIGQHVWDYISRFRNDVYLDSPTAGGSDPDKFLGIDSDGKIIYRTGTEVASDIGAITSETGDISAVTAGTGLGGGGTTGAVNLSLDLTSGLSAVTPANGDSLATLDSDASTHQLTTISNLATLFAGTGLTASSSVIGVDAAQTQITSVGTIAEGTWQATPITTSYIGNLQVTEGKLSEELSGQISANTAKDTNVTTNLTATTHASQITINSSDGTNVVVAEASGSIAGVMTVAHHDKLDGIEASATADQTRSDIDSLGITVVGTIATGVWQGTAIAHAYIGADAIEGDNIADNAVDSEHYTNGSIDERHIADDQVTFAKALGVTPNIFGNVIKLLPSDFMANDDGGNTKFGVGYVDHAGSTFGMRAGNSATELFAFVSIPQGMTATHVDIFDKNDVAFEVFEIQVNATTMVSKGSGNCNTTVDITDVASTATNFLGIRVTTTTVNDKVYGGTVTIA